MYRFARDENRNEFPTRPPAGLWNFRIRPDCLFGVLFLWLATAAPSLADTRQVLLLESFGREFPPYAEFTTKLRLELASQSPDPIDFYEVSLARARRAEPERDAPFVVYLASLFANQKLD